VAVKNGRPLSEQLRRAIEASPKSRYQLAKETCVSQSVLSLFCNKNRGLSLRAVDALAAALDLELKPRKRKES
jgi:transcriptional regulator with XRE-family HTH domain